MPPDRRSGVALPSVPVKKILQLAVGRSSGAWRLPMEGAMNAITAVAMPSGSRVGVLRRLRRRPPRTHALRVGIDLVEIDAVAATLDSPLSDRYLARVYTPGEIRDCTDANGIHAGRLAARFAAKEAVMKALDVGTRAIPWQSVEVERQPSGCPTLALHGAAASIARSEGVSQFALSLSHEALYAFALVVASS